MVLNPLIALLPMAALLWRHRLPLGRRPQNPLEEQALAARIVLVCLTAGSSLLGALELAAARTSGEVSRELAIVTRRSRRDGIAQALTYWPGPHTHSLLNRMAVAATSGAPLLDAVAAYLAEVRLDRRARSLEKVRRLPVTLMIPLGLLILPGFVLLFAGPILLGSISELITVLPA
jgi:tight adherence protein B